MAHKHTFASFTDPARGSVNSRSLVSPSRRRPRSQHFDDSLVGKSIRLSLVFPTASDDVKTHASPPLKWAGGKRWLVPILRELYMPNARRRLVEPFVGGMAVALGLQPQRALLNDINVHLISFYLNLQRGLLLGDNYKNDSVYFYDARSRFNNLIKAGRFESSEAASLFYYLNRTCYNGLCRFNSSGFFNVPFGRYKSISYRGEFLEYVEALSSYQFSAVSFRELAISPDDFLYADPPYDVQFTSYSAEKFSWREQVELADWLAAHQGPVVASNQATQRILALYRDRGFEVRTLPGPRRISCNGDRTVALEMLATRGLAGHALPKPADSSV